MKTAKPKVDNALEDMKSSAQKAYVKLDSEYDLSDRAAKAAKRFQETAKDVDQQYRIRRRIRSATEQLQKAWPIWSRRFEEFSSTTPGKFAIGAGVVLLLSTPLFWRVLNTILLLWWLALPLATYLLQRAQLKQAEEAEREAERRRNPFASMFRGTGFDARSRGGSNTGRSSKRSDDSPIIDAEWRPLDDKQ